MIGFWMGVAFLVCWQLSPKKKKNNLQLAIKNYERMDVLLGFGIWFNGKWGKRLLGFFPPCSDVLGGKRLSGYCPKIFGQFRREAAFRIFSHNFWTIPEGSGFQTMTTESC
jgi:hypothetical protein